MGGEGFGMLRPHRQNSEERKVAVPSPDALNFELFGRNTPEEQAGLFVWPSLAGPAVSATERRLLLLYRPSGVVLFRRNLQSLGQAQALVAELRMLLPGVCVGIDEEGGRVARLPWPVPRGLPALQMADAQGVVRGKIAQDATHVATEQATLQAFVCQGLGIDVVFAPVADILTEENNPVMGDRCYGRTPQGVSAFVRDVSRVFLSNGISPCVKHFPGHGNTTTDSHVDFAHSLASPETLQTREWVPFVEGFKAGVPFCMTAHVCVPSLDPLPATLSARILKDELRGRLGFQGLVLSDDMRMKAMALHYGVNDSVSSAAIFEDVEGLAGRAASGYLNRASVDALKAGCDVVLSCQSIVLEEEVLAGVAAGLQNDEGFAQEMRSRLAWFWRTGVGQARRKA